MKTIEDICKHCKHYLSCLRGAEFKTCKLKQSPHERALDFGLMLRSHGESEDSYTCGAASYEKGAEEQKKIDDKIYEGIIAEECTASYESGLEQGRRDMINKACEWLGNYLMEIGCPDDWMRDSPHTMSGEDRFRKAMEE